MSPEEKVRRRLSGLTVIERGGPKDFLGGNVTEVLVPRYLIRQKCLWGGWRMGKKPVIEHPAYKFGKVTTVIDGAPQLKGFEGWEYRFWAAVEMEDKRGVIAECRGCLAVFSDTMARKLHLGPMGCAKRLTAAYKLLLKDKMCVICNMRSYKEKWGVPLCSPTCEQAWREVESQPDPLKAALQLVGDNP